MFISKKARTSPRSGIRYMHDLATNYDNVINLGIGEPGFNTPNNIVKTGIKALEEGWTKYTPNAGILELREAIARKMRKENNINANGKNDIIVTTGAGEAMILVLLAIINPGEEVLVPDPYFPNYRGQIHLSGGKMVPIRTYEENGFCVKAEDIESNINNKTKALIINSPSNPTGAVLSKEELEEIGKVIKKHNILVISDEPYEKLIYDDNEHVSIASLPGMEDYTITINSFSKTYAMTGWRVGYAQGPPDIIGTMTKLQEGVSSCVNAAAQKACIEAMEGPQDCVEGMAKEYKKRRDFLISELNSIPKVKCIPPKGAFYAFPNIKEFGLSSVEVAKLLLDKYQVVVTPGNAFGEGGEGYLRISFAATMEDLEVGVSRIKKLLSEQSF